MVEIRRALPEDINPLADTIATAFAVDPAWSFITGAGNHDAMAAFARTLLIPRVRAGTAWMEHSGAAIAMWDRCAPEPDANDDHDSRWQGFRESVGEPIWARLEAYDHAVHAAAPARPYWYLGVLATRPESRGRGLATAVLTPGFEAAAADGWDCWLETSTIDNLEFYAGRGFTQQRGVDIPGGPATWWMQRPPRS